jgi:tetratricopeptide (TPR) repeat protein
MIHLAFDRVSSTLEHELVHVMIEPFGNPLGVSMSQGLLEGSAVAIENDMEWRSIHTDAAALYRLKMAPPPAKIMGVGGFTAQRASVAYLIAGSFSRWLIDRYGMPKYLKAFAWGDFDGAYGHSLDSLSEQYMRFILTQTENHIDPEWIDLQAERVTMRYLYGGGSFFYQRCLRRLGALNAEGYRALAEERYDVALDRFRASMEEGITYSARGGVLRALLAMGQYREMLDSANVYDRDTASYPLLPFLIERGDAYWALGDRSRARHLYDSVDRLRINLPTTMRASLRMFFIQFDSDSIRASDSTENVGALMRLYFTRSMSPLQRIEILDRAIRATTDPAQRGILSLMKATLIAPSLPHTAATIVRETLVADFGAARSRVYPYDTFDPASYLMHGLSDADLYYQVHERSIRARGIDPLSDQFRYPGGTIFLPDHGASITETESHEARFARFLSTGAIRP